FRSRRGSHLRANQDIVPGPAFDGNAAVGPSVDGEPACGRDGLLAHLAMADQASIVVLVVTRKAWLGALRRLGQSGNGCKEENSHREYLFHGESHFHCSLDWPGRNLSRAKVNLCPLRLSFTAVGACPRD